MRRVTRRLPIPEPLYGTEAREAKERIAEHYRRSAEERERRRIPFFHSLWASESVRQSLYETFQGKCAYCETLFDSLDHLRVHHHRPREGASTGLGKNSSADHYGWFAYEWDNLFATCGECDRAKSNFFPLYGPRAQVRCTWDEAEASEQALLINPCRSEPRKHLAFWTDGSVVPLDEVGETTIEVLALDRPELFTSRARWFEKSLSMLYVAPKRPEAMEGLRQTLEDRAAFAGASRIWLYDLFSSAAPRLGLAKPRYRSLLSDIAQIGAVASPEQWSEVIDMAKSREPDFGEPRYLRTVPAEASEAYTRQRTMSAQLRSVEIKDFKGVQRLRLEIPEATFGSSTEASCMMLLGENSTGKSSTLQAIALALMEPKMRKRMGVSAQEFLPREAEGWHLDDTVTPEVTLEFQSGEVVSLRIDPLKRAFVSADHLPYVLFAFGARRFFGKDVEHRQAASPLRSLFDPFAKLQHPGRWLQRLGDNEFNAVARAMREVLVLQGEDSIERDEDGHLSVRAHGRSTPLDRLSDGYRSLMAMVLDVMRGMIDIWGNLESARGLVLIDEIETHLHPRWKLRVMSALRRAMPYVQFIVTTHDPLCLRGMRDGEVQVLVRDSHQQIQVLKGLPDVRGLRAEQLLTSDYFGLSSTADPEVEGALQRLALPHGDNSVAAAGDREALRSLRWIGDTPFEQVVNEALRRYISEAEDEPALDRAQVREDAVTSVLERLRQMRAGLPQ